MEHVEILGGEEYLPFALARIKALRDAGMEYAVQRFEPPGASVYVEICGDQSFIRIEGSPFLLVTATVNTLDDATYRPAWFMIYPGSHAVKKMNLTFHTTTLHSSWAVRNKCAVQLGGGYFIWQACDSTNPSASSTKHYAVLANVRSGQIYPSGEALAKSKWYGEVLTQNRLGGVSYDAAQQTCIVPLGVLGEGYGFMLADWGRVLLTSTTTLSDELMRSGGRDDPWVKVGNTATRTLTTVPWPTGASRFSNGIFPLGRGKVAMHCHAYIDEEYETIPALSCMFDVATMAWTTCEISVPFACLDGYGTYTNQQVHYVALNDSGSVWMIGAHNSDVRAVVYYPSSDSGAYFSYYRALPMLTYDGEAVNSDVIVSRAEVFGIECVRIVYFFSVWNANTLTTVYFNVIAETFNGGSTWAQTRYTNAQWESLSLSKVFFDACTKPYIDGDDQGKRYELNCPNSSYQLLSGTQAEIPSTTTRSVMSASRLKSGDDGLSITYCGKNAPFAAIPTLNKAEVV